MSEINIGELVQYYWSTSRVTKRTPSGWTSGNAVCCVHRGHSADTRKRGGIHTELDGSFVYSCFNCGYSAAWEPGRLLSNRCKKLFSWLNVSDDDIRAMSFHALKHSHDSQLQTQTVSIPVFHEVDLPENARAVDEQTPVHVLEYIAQRKLDHALDQLYYSTHKDHSRQLIIPFVRHGRTVGWTARNIGAKRIRYMSNVQPGYVYGLDQQSYHAKFVLVTEGVIDAMHIHGVSVLGSDVNQMQLSQINQLNRPIILVPDRDSNGTKMVNWALDHEWLVSFPEWESGVNDISDAVDRYGRLATFGSIITGTCSSKLKAQLKQKKWFENGN